jgi:predicted polyphosphate/ATP-dependent NAD kinase
MNSVGIIANPASGKDIRRLVASGTVVSNQEKINIVVRAILAMDSLGVERVVIMPDPSHIGERVVKQLASQLQITTVEILKLPYLLGTWKDTLRSARMMREIRCSSIVVLGGDGTSRIVAKESRHIPLIPVSTGTNNVFPQMVEGTLVGIAAAALATGAVSKSEVCLKAPRLELYRNGELADIALVDLAVVDAADSAAKAVWEAETIKEVFLTHASPANIGLSAIGGYLPGARPGKGDGLHVVLGDGDLQINAPIAPGLMQKLSVKRYAVFKPDDEVPLITRPAMIALDGEREFGIREDESVTVRVSRNGPVVLQIGKTLELAAQRNCSHFSGESVCA